MFNFYSVVNGGILEMRLSHLTTGPLQTLVALKHKNKLHTLESKLYGNTLHFAEAASQLDEVKKLEETIKSYSRAKLIFCNTILPQITLNTTD